MLNRPGPQSSTSQIFSTVCQNVLSKWGHKRLMLILHVFNFLTFQIILRQETEQTEGVKNSPISEHRCWPEKAKQGGGCFIWCARRRRSGWCRGPTGSPTPPSPRGTSPLQAWSRTPWAQWARWVLIFFEQGSHSVHYSLFFIMYNILYTICNTIEAVHYC